jgi:hypothetical protein
MSSHQWNHFMAQSYLKGFSPYYFDEKALKNQKMKVWFYSKNTKVLKLASVDKVARRPRWYSWRIGKHSYDNEIEEGLSRFEGRYISLIRKLERDIEEVSKAGTVIGTLEPRQLHIEPEDIAYLASYMCLHVIRIPSFFEKLREMAKERQKEFDEKGLGDISSHGMPGFENTALLAFAVSGPKVNEKVVKILMNKNVSILFGATRRCRLMSCDNPVLRKDNFEIFIFPLYQRACIQFWGQGNILRYVPVRDAKVFEAINVNLCGVAKEEVYSGDLKGLTKILERLGLEYDLSKEADAEMNKGGLNKRGQRAVVEK